MSAVVAPRPTNWKFILIVSGTALVLGFFFLKGFWFPYQDNEKRLAGAQDEYENQRSNFLVFQKEKKRLERDRLIGLPRDLSHAESEYVKYLRDLLAKCGFDARPDVTSTGADLRNVSSTQGAKKAGHIVVPFNVRAQGTWTCIVKFLDGFQRTPFLHRLRSWKIDAPSSAKESPGKLKISAEIKLSMNVVIEALIVNRNDQRPDSLWGVDPRLIAVDAILGMNRLPTGWATLLRAQGLLLPEMSKRSYALVPRLNPFVGGIPISTTPTPDLLADKAKKDKAIKDAIKDAQAKASLVMTSEPKQALLVAPMPTDPTKTVGTKLAPDQTFPVWEGKNAKVLRIDHLNVYFQFEGKTHAIHIGEKMKDALARPLSPLEIRNLGLPGG